MKLLSLDRLVGPADSVHENFEVMCLELIKKTGGYTDLHRNLPPDRGVDIWGQTDDGRNTVFQCKAYRSFSSALCSSLKDSISTANKYYDRQPWHTFVLLIPFVPTAPQREKLREVLRDCRAPTMVLDGDELETRLYEHPDIVARFFPTVNFVLPPGTTELVLEQTVGGQSIRLLLESTRTGQRFPLKLGADVPLHGVMNYLVYSLRLPQSADVSRGGALIASHKIEWYLKAIREGEAVALDMSSTAEATGLQNGEVLRLMYTTCNVITGGFATRIGVPKSVLTSSIFTDEEMGSRWREKAGHFEAQQLDEYLVDRFEQLQGPAQ